MGWLMLLFLAVLAANLQYSLLAACSWAPHLPIALVAWLVARLPPEQWLGRLWLVALAQDLWDPASRLGHQCLVLGVALLWEPLASRLQWRGASGQMAWVLVFLLADALRWHQFHDAPWPQLGAWSLTILGTMLVSLLFAGWARWLPRFLHPLPPPKSPTWFAESSPLRS